MAYLGTEKAPNEAAFTLFLVSFAEIADVVVGDDILRVVGSAPCPCLKTLVVPYFVTVGVIGACDGSGTDETNDQDETYERCSSGQNVLPTVGRTVMV